MKPVAKMSIEELGAFVCQALEDSGVVVTLTGGACVAIWSRGKYISHDLDFIEEGPVPRARIRRVLEGLGFKEQGRHFVRRDVRFFVEFPSGPLMVGDERVERVRRRRTPVGTLRLLVPTDCVKDRLAAFFHWKDRQSLEQALLVAKTRKIDLKDIRRWSRAEGHEPSFGVFERKLKKLKGQRRKDSR
jgi:hypothetical protein